MKRVLLAKRLLIGLTALAASPAFAQTVAITNATIATGEATAPSRGTVVIQNGRVTGVGNVSVPAGATVVDGTGKWVTPGIVAGFTRLGLVGVDGVDSANDVAARGSPFNAAIDVAAAINPNVPAVTINRAAGVTRAVVAPGASGSLFAGQGAIIDTASDMQPVTRARAFQFVEFGEDAARIAGGSRPAALAMFRNALIEAQRYARSPGSFDGNSKQALLTAADAEALGPVIDGRVPLWVHVEGATDILSILAVKREFPALKLVLVGASEGWTVARQIAAAGVSVVASPLNDLPSSFETLAATQSNIGRMRAAGVDVAIGTIDDDEPRMATRTRQYAGNLVALSRVPRASGLSWGEAFASITSVPARLAGIGPGTLSAGGRDVVLWSGDPLELSSHAERVWIDGVEQPMVTRQQRLRDRYRTAADGALPKAYDR